MEYIDGMSLKAYVASQGGKIPYDQALTILMPVMQALTQVHALNLTHRDISPDNISITSKGESKLLDFGAARFSIGDEKSVSVILKHGYAPEEQYSSKGNQGPWTDVYAMGATLYRCVTGELPPDSIMRVHNDTLKKPSELGVPLPPQVEQAIMKALAVKAEDRFSTMEAFTTTETGSRERTCSICKYTQEETIPVHEHSIHDEAWKYDDTEHWQECSCGERLNVATHTYGDWKVTKEATETEEGSRECGCAVCEYVQTEAIPAAGTGSPQTGDSSDMALWISLMLASCGGVLGMLFYRRKKAVAGK